MSAKFKGTLITEFNAENDYFDEFTLLKTP